MRPKFTMGFNDCRVLRMTRLWHLLQLIRKCN